MVKNLQFKILITFFHIFSAGKMPGKENKEKMKENEKREKKQ